MRGYGQEKQALNKTSVFDVFNGTPGDLAVKPPTGFEL